MVEWEPVGYFWVARLAFFKNESEPRRPNSLDFIGNRANEFITISGVNSDFGLLDNAQTGDLFTHRFVTWCRNGTCWSIGMFMKVKPKGLLDLAFTCIFFYQLPIDLSIASWPNNSILMDVNFCLFLVFYTKCCQYMGILNLSNNSDILKSNHLLKATNLWFQRHIEGWCPAVWRIFILFQNLLSMWNVNLHEVVIVKILYDKSLNGT